MIFASNELYDEIHHIDDKAQILFLLRRSPRFAIEFSSLFRFRLPFERL